MWEWLAAGLLACLVGWSAVSVRRILYPPRRQVQPAAPAPEGQPLCVPLPDGTSCTVWRLAAAAPRGRVLFCHGYSADRTQVGGVARGLSALGFECLVMELRGHGERPGPCTLGLREADDAHAILDWAAEQDAGRPMPTAILGFSMGAAALLQAAARRQDLRAAVADSAYPRLFPLVRAVIRQRYHLPAVPFAWVSWWAAQVVLRARLAPRDPIVLARRLRLPLLALQGGEDRRVSARDHEALFACWAGPKERWADPAAAHVGLWARDPDGYCRRVAAFLARYIG